MALNKGLPILESVITKAKAEEQAKMAQDRLIKGMKQKELAEVSVVEVDMGKLGKLKKKSKYCDRTVHGRNPDEQTMKNLCKAYGKACYKCEGSGHLANVCTVNKEDSKSNARTAVQGEDKSRAVFKLYPDEGRSLQNW